MTEIIVSCVVCNHFGFSVKSGDEGIYFLVIIGKHILDIRQKTVSIRLQQYNDLPLEIKPMGGNVTHCGSKATSRKLGGKESIVKEGFSFGERLDSTGSSGVLLHCQQAPLRECKES